MMLVVATISFTFSQNSSQIYQDWQKEREKIKEKNEDPEIIQNELNKLDSTYISFYRLALENEKTPITTTSTQQSMGGSFSLPNFQGKSINITKAAEAYAKVKMTDAKADYIRNMNSNNSNGESNSSSGYIGVIVNNFPYYMTTVVVTECDENWKPVNGGFNYTFELKPGEKMEYSLLPGKWIIKSTAWNSYTKFNPRIKCKDLDPLSFSYYEGKKYYWGSINGFE